MKTKLWAIGLMIICAVITSSAQILFKMGVDQASLNFIAIITNLPLILGVILYVSGAVLVIIALKGGEVTVLYPIITSSYVLVTLGSNYFFGEQIGLLKWAGITLIIGGILMITVGEKDKELIEFTEPV